MSKDIVTDEAVCQAIGSVIGKSAAKGAVTSGMNLRADLGVDSIGLMSIVFVLEERFGIDAFSHVQEFITSEHVSDLIDIVRRG